MPALLLSLLAAASLAAAPVVTPSVRAAEPPSTPSNASRPAALLTRVSFDSQDDLNRLAGRLDLTAAVDRARGTVEAVLSPEEYDALVKEGRRVELLEEGTRRLNAPRERLAEQRLGISGYACYRTVDETYASMQELANTYPRLAQWRSIGDSWDRMTPGGNPGDELKVLVLTNRARLKAKPRFFLMAAIHAREYATAELAARFAEELVNRYEVDADARWLLDYHEVHIVVQSNPDGRRVAETGLSKRKNTNTTQGSCSAATWGVDLNRNSSFDWNQGGTTTSACGETYLGRTPASEPETQALENYILSLYADRRGPAASDPAAEDTSGVMISLHSYGGWVLYPWGADTSAAPNEARLRTLGRKFNYFNGYQACPAATCLYVASGSTDTFAYGVLGVPSYTIEVGTEFFQSCSSFENVVLPNNMPALWYALKATRRPYQSPAGPDSVTLSLSAAAVRPGTPVTLYAQADDTRYGTNGGVEPTQNIAAARYSVDAPSWVSGTPTYALTPLDGAFDSPVEQLQGTVFTSTLTPGKHILFVESQDASGNWGVPTAIFLTVVQ